MTQKTGLRQKKNIQVKDALYNAAMQLFRRQGFEATSVDEIAEEAGYSRATFFNHFGTKQGVLRHYGQELLAIVENISTHAATDSSLDLIQKMLFAMITEARDNLEDVRLICTYSMLDPVYLTHPTPSRKRIAEIFTQLVSKAQQDGQIRVDLNAENLALHILLLYQGVVLSLVADVAADADSLQHSMWQFILGGVKNDNFTA